MGATSLLCCLALMAACVFQGHWCWKRCNAGIKFKGGRKMFEISPGGNVLIEFSVCCEKPVIEALNVTGKTPKLLCHWVCPSSNENCFCTHDGYILKISADEQTPSSQTFQITVDGGQKENVTIILDSYAHSTNDNDNTNNIRSKDNTGNISDMFLATMLSLVFFFVVTIITIVVSCWKRSPADNGVGLQRRGGADWQQSRDVEEARSVVVTEEEEHVYAVSLVEP
ncbi:uncharacterized protein LOC143291773 [Babylonia areolata]|uniref:uncharacterized protein LOC143291773 n=1 Tax=Babylonia areolata TaxID=304850 RepID=UPI003FD41DA2